MKQKTELIIGAIFYIIWAIMGAFIFFEELRNPYIPEHGFILFMGLMPFALPILILIMALFDKEEPKPL